MDPEGQQGRELVESLSGGWMERRRLASIMDSGAADSAVLPSTCPRLFSPWLTNKEYPSAGSELL